VENRRGARSLEYDLTTGQGVVRSRAVFHGDLLRLPYDRMHLFFTSPKNVTAIFGHSTFECCLSIGTVTAIFEWILSYESDLTCKDLKAILALKVF
jgi:hypothetical protein